jgi:hypothetical protein
MDLKMVHHPYVVGNFLDHQYLLDVEYLDALQNRDELNQDVVLTFQLVHLVRLLDVVVDAELRHQLKMDCYQDAVGEEQMRHLLKMDCYRDVELPVLLLRHLLYLKSFLLQLALGLAQ